MSFFESFVYCQKKWRTDFLRSRAYFSVEHEAFGEVVRLKRMPAGEEVCHTRKQ